MKYLTNSGLSYFFNKIKAYLTSSTYLNSIGISNTDVDDIADDAGYSSGSLPASEDIFITGDIIPNTDNSVDLGASSKNIKMIYTKGITINGTQFLPSDYIPRSGGAVTGNIDFDSTWNYASSNQGWFPASVAFVNSSSSLRFGFINIYDDSSRAFRFFLTDHTGNEKNILNLGIDSNNDTFITGYNNKAVAMAEDVVPRSGGAVITGSYAFFGKNNALDGLMIGGGDERHHGGDILLMGTSDPYTPGAVCILPNVGNGSEKFMFMYPSGTWTWDGTACQITSDQRLKQQITQIDNALLDAWEDVELVQFKYNDAVNEKGDNARLHTGYVVQQIDTACKSHNVDISEYGLYCHEEYPEETEEVEVEQEDGTIKKETKVIREASEHYSLRYTETLVVECAYLRKKIKELEERLEKLELQ